ncbi:MAG: DUF4384 domain-containing protein [Smithellaceae bacterium]|nr:DUF4384 domain-containing protein [Smithellaceae bacterium]
MKLKSLLIAVMLFLPALCFATENSIWVEATGNAQQSEVETPKEVKERAKVAAESNAVEKAVGTFVKSHTLVSNSQLAEDLIYAAARGKIEKIEVTEEGWDKTDRSLYQVKIKALVSPVFPERDQGLTIRLSLSKTDVKEGEEVKIFYQPTSDCYVYIFSIAADGSVTLLLPNSVNKDNFARAGKAYQFPADGSRMALKAMFLPGFNDSLAEEKIKIIATRKKEELLSLGFREGIFQVYDAASTGMISDLVRRLNHLDPTEWTEATAVYFLSK